MFLFAAETILISGCMLHFHLQKTEALNLSLVSACFYTLPVCFRCIWSILAGVKTVNQTLGWTRQTDRDRLQKVFVV